MYSILKYGKMEGVQNFGLDLIKKKLLNFIYSRRKRAKKYSITFYVCASVYIYISQGEKACR